MKENNTAVDIPGGSDVGEGLTISTSVELEFDAMLTSMGVFAELSIEIESEAESAAKSEIVQTNEKAVVVQVPMFAGVSPTAVTVSGSLIFTAVEPVIEVKEIAPTGSRTRLKSKPAVAIFLLLNLGFSVMLDDCFGTI